MKSDFLNRKATLRPRGELSKNESGQHEGADIITLDVMLQHFDALPDAIALFDTQDRAVYVNKTMEELLIYHGANFEDRDFLMEIISASGSNQPDVEVEGIFSGESAAIYDRVIAIKSEDSRNNRYYDMSLQNAFIPDQDGEDTLKCVMLVLSNITGLVRAKEEAESASLAKGELFYRISHEVRLSVHAIADIAHAARAAKDMEEITACLKKIENATDYLQSVIDDILDISLIWATSSPMNSDAFRIGENLEYILFILSLRAEQRHIRLKFYKGDIKNDLIECDITRYNRILMNLISGVIHFSPEHTTVEIRVDETESGKDHSVIGYTIQNEDMDITPRELEQLVRPPDYSYDNKNTHENAGVGLMIAGNLAEMLGGRVTVEGAGENGSVLKFTIKVKTLGDLGENRVDVALEAKNEFAGLRALVVDDLDISRIILMELLSDTGIIIDQAENGQQALARFALSEAGAYDVVFMDMQMPVMDGCSAARQLRAMNRPDARTVPIICMTASILQSDVDLALSAGMNAHVGKPLDYQAVVEVLRRLLP